VVLPLAFFRNELALFSDRFRFSDLDKFRSGKKQREVFLFRFSFRVWFVEDLWIVMKVCFWSGFDLVFAVLFYDLGLLTLRFDLRWWSVCILVIVLDWAKELAQIQSCSDYRAGPIGTCPCPTAKHAVPAACCSTLIHGAYPLLLGSWNRSTKIPAGNSFSSYSGVILAVHLIGLLNTAH
jgi:hypothetical protein